MTLIDGNRIITVQLYDDEHEEFTEKKMSIIDYINAYTDEGVTTSDDVLNKIRAEIEDNRDEWIEGQDAEWSVYNRCLRIIDKYKAESEDSSKINCSKTKCENCTNHNYCDYEPQADG